MESLEFLTMILLVFIATAFLISTRKQKPQRKESEPHARPNNRKKTPDVDDLMNVLDHMLAMNVIDTKEYNQLIVKSAPHFK